jgi:tetratricopeptide (TPR) repeat protein
MKMMRQSTEPSLVNAQIEHIWSLIRDANVREARAESEQLVADLQAYVDEMGDADGQLLNGLASACHLAGYTTSMSTRNRYALRAVRYFERMEQLACTLADDALFVIALTYQGDAYRRAGNLKEARKRLQAAYVHVPQELAALGNCAQLLGRVYFLSGDMDGFEAMMKQAEKLAKMIDQEQNILHGQYCLGTVYIDYARYYSKAGKNDSALAYLKLAEKHLPATIHWYTLLTATRGIVLIKSNNIAEGMPAVIKAVQLGREHGNERLLDKFYELERFLGFKAIEISEAKMALSGKLEEALKF